MQKVFISYSRKDIDFARKLADDLEKTGFEVWWDISDLKGGDDWVRVIPSAIEASQYFIILLSPDSVASQWVEREYLHALNSRLKVLPLLIRPCSVPFALANINYIDFTGPDPVANLNRLLADINYTGERVQETALANKSLLPPSLDKHKYALLGGLILGIILLSALIFRSCAPAAPISPTPTFTNSPTPSLEPTLTPTRLTPTREPTATPADLGQADTLTPNPPTVTPSPTITDTFTPEITVTPSLTKETSLRVELCIHSDFTTLVRTGPGKSFGALPNPLKGDDCLLFSATNDPLSGPSGPTWYMIAPRQPDARFREFEYGWVSAFTLALENAAPFTLPVATPMPTATRTQPPTYTPTITPTSTFTQTLIPSPTDTHTPLPTDTRVPTSTSMDLLTIEPTETPTP
jgi:hypothetical protein